MNWSGAACLVLYLALPHVLERNRGPDARPLDFKDTLAILCLWLPIEFRWLPDLKLSGISLPFLLGLANACLLFSRMRPPIGIRFPALSDVRLAITTLFFLAATLIPLGSLLHFLVFTPSTPSLFTVIKTWLGIYFLVALPEEILFRGILQNKIEQRSARPFFSLFISATIFGIAHLNNVSQAFLAPNWRYAILATIAGAGYGWVWVKTRKATASALVHASVNTLWKLLFIPGA